MDQFFGCYMAYPRCKEDCYWYGEWQDMGSHVPYCKCKSADFIEPKDCENCEQYHSKYRPTTADRIRAMTDEKLAKWLSDMHDSVTCPNNGAVDCNPSCKKCWLDWLKQEVESDA